MHQLFFFWRQSLAWASTWSEYFHLLISLRDSKIPIYVMLWILKLQNNHQQSRLYTSWKLKFIFLYLFLVFFWVYRSRHSHLKSQFPALKSWTSTNHYFPWVDHFFAFSFLMRRHIWYIIIIHIFCHRWYSIKSIGGYNIISQHFFTLFA